MLRHLCRASALVVYVCVYVFVGTKAVALHLVEHGLTTAPQDVRCQK